jgi:hypothetical protein
MADFQRQIMNLSVYQLLFVLVFVVALTFGCGRNPPTTLKSSQPPKTYTESDLTKLIIPGMSAEEVTNRFGTPNSTIEIDQDTVLFMYNFPLQPQNEALHLAGFDIYIKNGNVVKWSPTMEQSWQNYGPGSSPSSLVEQSFQVFLATGNLTNVANTIDTEGSADASNLRTSPDLAFQAQVFAGSSGSERPEERTVILVVSDQDAGKLKDLTEQNFGKRLLIVCRNKVIAAPVISSPLNSRQLMFTVKSSVLDILRSR